SCSSAGKKSTTWPAPWSWRCRASGPRWPTSGSRSTGCGRKSATNRSGKGTTRSGKSWPASSGSSRGNRSGLGGPEAARPVRPVAERFHARVPASAQCHVRLPLGQGKLLAEVVQDGHRTLNHQRSVLPTANNHRLAHDPLLLFLKQGGPTFRRTYRPIF